MQSLLSKLHRLLFPSDFPEPEPTPAPPIPSNDGEIVMSEVTQANAAPAAPTTVTIDPTAIAVNTIKAIVPGIITAVVAAAGAGAAANPASAVITALAPVALQLIQAATQMQAANAMSAQELQDMWTQVASGITQAQSAWNTMNKQGS